MIRHQILVPLSFLLVLAGCSEAPKRAAEATNTPAEPISGRSALFHMYTTARGWAPDAQLLQLRSIPISGVKVEPGKCGAWQATFVSPSMARSRTYTYSVVEAEGNLHKGVFGSSEESYSGPRGQAGPFLMAAVKTDSDEVLKAAMGKAAEYAKKHPNVPINFLLEANNRFPDPSWRVIWGESVSTSGFSIFVDAETGKYLQTAE